MDDLMSFCDAAYQHEHQPAMDEGSFHHSLHQLKLQLEEMNKRTAEFLHLHNQRSPYTNLPSTGDLHLPTGPAFWQLYRTLRGDIRVLDARIELIEESIQTLSDRVDDIEPTQLTPPDSPVTMNDYGSTPVGVETTATVSDPRLVVVDTPFWGVFDPSANSDLGPLDLYTSDVFTFVAKLRRASRTKPIVDVEQHLRGMALRYYQLAYRTDGTNSFDLANGNLDVELFGRALIDLFRPDAVSLIRTETYTNFDAINGRKLIEDYAFKLIDLGRYNVDEKATGEAALCDMVNQGIRIDLPETLRKGCNGTLANLPSWLREVENYIKETTAQGQHIVRDDKPAAESPIREMTMSPPSYVSDNYRRDDSVSDSHVSSRSVSQHSKDRYTLGTSTLLAHAYELDSPEPSLRDHVGSSQSVSERSSPISLEMDTERMSMRGRGQTVPNSQASVGGSIRNSEDSLSRLETSRFRARRDRHDSTEWRHDISHPMAFPAYRSYIRRSPGPCASGLPLPSARMTSPPGMTNLPYMPQTTRIPNTSPYVRASPRLGQAQHIAFPAPYLPPSPRFGPAAFPPYLSTHGPPPFHNPYNQVRPRWSTPSFDYPYRSPYAVATASPPLFQAYCESEDGGKR